jgi:hypothetical protein
MPPNCRSQKARVEIYRNYKLVPLAHVDLIAGQVKPNLAGGNLKGSYYAFEFEEKANPSHRGTFFCGYVCGDHFCALLGVSPIPAFNPLAALVAPSTSPKVGALLSPRSGLSASWDPLNKELYEAINLHVIISNSVPRGGYGATLRYLINNPGRRTSPDYVIRFNRYLEAAYGGATLLSKLPVGAGLRVFSFPEIGNLLAAERLLNYYG